MKKLLLGLGTLAAVATPVTAVVACGSTHGGDISGHKETPSEKALRQLMEGSSTVFQAWTMSSEDLAERIVSTKTEGLLDLDISLNQGANQFKAQAVFSDKITKQEIIDKANDSSTPLPFDEIATKVKAALKGDDAWKYSLVVSTIQSDSDKNDGQYQIDVFKKTQEAIDGLTAASTILQDPTKFKLDSASIAKLHGAYTYGLHHNFSGSDINADKYTIKMKESGGIFSGLFGALAGTNGATYFGDRIKEDSVYTWSMFKPIGNPGLDGAEVADQIFVLNKQTGIYNIRFELKKGNFTRTIYLENPLVTSFELPKDGDKMHDSWMVNKFDDDKFKKIWNEKFTFTNIYNMFNGMKSNAGQLNKMEPLKDLIMNISSSINTMASSYNEMKDPANFKEFIQFLKDKFTKDSPSGDIDHLMVGLQDFKMYDDKDMYTKYMAAIGPMGYNGLIWSNKVLEAYVEFVDMKVEKKEMVLSKITTSKDLADALKAEKELKVKADKLRKYMTDNKIVFDDKLNDQEIIDFFKTKATKNITDAKSVTSVMTAITATDDKHLSDAYTALLAEISKQEAVDTNKFTAVELYEYSNKLMKLHSEIAKVNAAIVSINADATFDTDDVIKELQKLGIRIPGLVSINVPDSVLSAFVAKAKAAVDNDGRGGFLSRPSSKLNLLEDFIGKNINSLFSDDTFKKLLGWGGKSHTYKENVEDSIKNWKNIVSPSISDGKISQDTYDILEAIYALIA